MINKKIFFLICFFNLSIYLFAQNLPQNKGRRIFPSPTASERERENGASNEVKPGMIDGISPTSPAYSSAELGRQKMAEKKFAEAKEAFKTAIRLEPMNPVLWGLYDNAHSEQVLANNINSSYGVLYGNLKPSFEISRTDSYIEANTMYIVGEVKNISSTKKQKIELTARFYNKENIEIRKSVGTLRNFDKCLLPNESCVFEIPLKDYPKGLVTFRVEVSAWD